MKRSRKREHTKTTFWVIWKTTFMKNNHWGPVMLSSNQTEWLQCRVNKNRKEMFSSKMLFLSAWRARRLFHPVGNLVTAKSSPTHNSHTTLTAHNGQVMRCTWKAENSSSSAEWIYSNPVGRAAKGDVLIPTPLPLRPEAITLPLHIMWAPVTMTGCIIKFNKC